MSFSDFGRTAMAALSPMGASTQPPPSGVSKSRNVRRSSDPLLTQRSVMDGRGETTMTVDGRRRTKSSRDVMERGGRKPPLLGTPPSRRRRSDGGAIIGHKGASAKNTLEIKRGVRPRLDNIQCPVTQKTLMDDVLTVQGDEGCIDASLASTSISSSTTNHEHSYDDDSMDQYSESDIGLNHSGSRGETLRRKDGSSRSASRSSHRSSSHIDGRKSDRHERDLENESHKFNTSQQQRRRRLPKHYNNIPEAAIATDGGRNATRAKEHRDSRRHSLSKKERSEKLQSNHTTKQRRNSASESPKLSTEVAQFQKMVADLESLSGNSASSPEAMWKSRILLRSAQDADRDLKVALEKEEREATVEGGTRSATAAARSASRKKLKRDHHRVSEQLRSIVEETERRQRAEISCLTASEAAASGGKPGGTSAAVAQKRASLRAAEAEEDFFDRAMRERQAEVQKISDGMKKVQNIYTDLAGLVDGQQEQIDKLEDINEEVKADTRAGLEEIQHGMWKLCVADQPVKNGESQAGSFHINSFDGPRNRGKKNKNLDPSDILNCMMVCHTPHKSQGGGGVLSLDENTYSKSGTIPHDLKSSGANYYRDDVPSSGAGWNLLNLEDVQESAQDAYERGQAMVGGIVGQVHDAVANGEGLPLQLREVGNRISCNPQPEEYFSSDNGDDQSNETGVVETENVKGGSERNGYREEDFSEERHRRHHHSSRRSRSRSRPGQKHHNRRHEDKSEQWEGDECLPYNDLPRKVRQNGHRHGQRRKSSSR